MRTVLTESLEAWLSYPQGQVMVHPSENSDFNKPARRVGSGASSVSERSA